MNKKICIMLMFFVFIFWNVSCQSGLGGLLNRGVEDIREVINDDQNPVGRVINDQNVRDDVSAAQEDFTPEQEYYIGRAVAANILSQYRLWNGNPALTAYLNNICAAITINSNPPEGDVFNGYHVAILDSTEINAFATSGGHILITRGLISAAKSEDALAAVIAHEVAHIQLKHSLKAIKESRENQARASGVRAGASVVAAIFNMNINDSTKFFAGLIEDSIKTILID
ncbi:MAG: M48 family metalloprotease, partial [Treponema sp.]|nr:M48 family metalloprotease [Treponema sp.]